MIRLRTLIAISLIAVAVLITGLQVYNEARRKASTVQTTPLPKKSLIRETESRLTKSQKPEEAYLALLQLESALRELPPENAQTIIESYLNTQQDAQTGLQFLLDADGFLETAPTLRVFLLDQEGAISPEAAAEYARTILAKPGSPDEWAIALRNYVKELKVDPSEDNFLKTKLETMFTKEDWSNSPTLGYLQAYDLIVFLGGTDFIPELSRQICDESNPATQYAARLTLDRLTLRHYAQTTRAMLENMSILNCAPEVRARMFARANVRDPDQRTIIEDYLLKQDLSERELETFANSFPNINLEISYNLVTREEKRSLAFYAEEDRASLAFTESLIATPDLSEHQQQVFTTLRERLSIINESLGRGEMQKPTKNQPAH